MGINVIKSCLSLSSSFVYLIMMLIGGNLLNV
jgi:hypothetical protein